MYLGFEENGKEKGGSGVRWKESGGWGGVDGVRWGCLEGWEERGEGVYYMESCGDGG